MKTSVIFGLLGVLSLLTSSLEDDKKIDQDEGFMLVGQVLQLLQEAGVKVPKKYMPLPGENLKVYLYRVVDRLVA